MRYQFMRFMALDGDGGNPPADPPKNTEKSFTKEDIDAAIEKERKKFADYEDLKKSKQELDELKKSQLSESEKIKAELDVAKAELEKKAAEIKSMKIMQLRAKLCNEAGLPAAFADRIIGDDEAAIKKDIEAVKEIIPATPVGGKGAPADGGDTATKKSGDPLRDAVAGYYNKK